MDPEDKQFLGVAMLALIAVILLGFQYIMLQIRERGSSGLVQQEDVVRAVPLCLFTVILSASARRIS